MWLVNAMHLPILVQGMGGEAGELLHAQLPASAWATLEALVMEPAQLASELGKGEMQGSPPPGEAQLEPPSAGARRWLWNIRTHSHRPSLHAC